VEIWGCLSLTQVVWRGRGRAEPASEGARVARRRSHRRVIGITCTPDTASLDSRYATFRSHRRRLSGDLLDCRAAVGVHDPRQSDDGSRAGMLQAYGPDVRFGEHAAVALLL
jgi:hypothetical protein